MGIKTKIEQKAQDTQSLLAVQAQARYIQWLMKEEQIDYEEALAIVQGRTDPLEPEYMLGYKLSDPVVMIALFKQPRKKKRLNAALNFADTLSPEEAVIFWGQVFDERTASQFKTKLKDEQKKNGIKSNDL